MDYLDANGLMYVLKKIKELYVTREEWQAFAAQAASAAEPAAASQVAQASLAQQTEQAAQPSLAPQSSSAGAAGPEAQA